MFKNMTISGKTNLITEILAAVVWLIAVASAGLDRLIVGVFSFPLLILVPICGWLLMPISKKILKKGETKIGWRKMLWYAGMFVANLIIAVLAATAVLAGGAALINMTDGGGIDEIGSALVLVFAAWMSAFRITSGNPRQFNYRDEGIQNNKKYCLQLFKSSHFLCEDFFCFKKIIR